MTVVIYFDNLLVELQVFVGDVYQFALDKMEALWCILIFQLDYGSIKLKAISFDMLLDLLKLQGMPSTRVSQSQSYLIFLFDFSID